ncbi:VOC family protein [Kribbella sp.]|uniref:VOC family protein n=1 Tax=Kribbella sp. TaxID=1871183 RepID=UPI002D38F5B0|nr:VOC family protein [Kribbella sp.]HZX04412.1 VOC family protein [Kribbella sp.]
MAVEFNHTIVSCTDKQASAHFLAEILGLGQPSSYGPFAVVQLANGTSLDFAAANGQVHRQHYAFLVSEDEFDQIHGRIVERGLTYWADPFHRHEGEINTNDNGRGLYWDDPDGHNLEILTVPYGGAA